ncbi:MAG: sulfite exporter TauE/SafE family protein [Candidatus Marinimicrobia bacterium]|nr:sulfite exporter TauE/SafE family protein [Candidatus Neomarinimicrobiota bacterium]
MPGPPLPVELLPVLFFLVALMYSSVGLGGGSSYTALMVIFGLSHRVIPTTSLTLNLLVSFLGMVNFWRGGHLSLRLVAPFLLASVPLAYLGGALSLSRELFHWLLLGSLVLVAARIYLWRGQSMAITFTPGQRWAVSLTLGGALGFIAGTVGIGGGIYLVPLILALGLAAEKEAAAAGSIFIWSNSLAGVISRTQRGTFETATILPLAVAVVAGGYLGSRLGATRLGPDTIRKTLGVIILIGIVFLIGRLI